MILIIDNYDSFVYNLAQYIGELGWEPVVFRNDQVTLEEIEASAPSHIVISPGPGTPRDAGISNDVVRYFSGKVPILGVCLGHQCIGYVHDGSISLSIERGTLPHYLKVTAVTEDGEVMGVRHERFVVEGVQFHPESILTEVGHHILKRFLSISHPFWGETG